MGEEGDREAKKYCSVNIAASAEDEKFSYAPPQASWKLYPDAAYVHYTGNETIGGVEFHWIPRNRRCAAGVRPVLEPAVAAARCVALRADLCGRAEKHRPGGPDDRRSCAMI